MHSLYAWQSHKWKLTDGNFESMAQLLTESCRAAGQQTELGFG
jgi:hypothetical protein